MDLNPPIGSASSGSTLGGYAVERELGRGGMATVYLARDVRHKRVVALKVLAPALGAALGPERFRREIELAAQLQHPHIVPVFDSGQDGELLWYTMPFVDGESLRERLARQGQISLTDVVSIVREVASALDYAHRKGVVHRDIKPENILLSDGQALVADFGIARSAVSVDERLTVTGLSLGTPYYMSPEQITGDAVDGRADQYALGCLVHELLAGQPPYSGPTAQAVIVKHMTEPVPLLRQVRPDLSAETERAVARAMAKSPADRFSSAAQFAGALVDSPADVATATTGIRRAPTGRRIWLAAGTIAVVLLAVGAIWWSHRGTGDVVPAEGPQVVAIQPFTSEDGRSSDYFTEGITDAVRGAFTGVGALRAVAAASRQGDDTSRTPQHLARALGATYVLTGRVRRLTRPDGAAGVEVDARLLRGSDARETWHGSLAASSGGLSSIGGLIAEAVAPALGQRLTDSIRARLEAPPTRSALAYDAYLRGRSAERAARQTEMDRAPGHREAIQQLEQAVAIDPAFASAWAALSSAIASLYFDGGAKSEDPPRALAAARRAITLAPRNPSGHIALGDYYAMIRQDLSSAVQEYGVARQLAPDDERTLRALADAEGRRANWPTAITLFEQLIKLQPDDAGLLASLSLMMIINGRYAEAASLADRALALSPSDLNLWRLRTTAAVATGDSLQVRAVFARARGATAPADLIATLAVNGMGWTLDDSSRALLWRLQPAAFGGDRVLWAGTLALEYWLTGDTSRARAYADSALPGLSEIEHDPSKVTTGLNLVDPALVYAVLGRRAEAERFARRAEQLSPLVNDVNGRGISVQLWLVEMDVVLGKREQAMQRIERVRAVAPGMFPPGELRLNPLFRSLRGLPSFQRLLANEEKDATP